MEHIALEKPPFLTMKGYEKASIKSSTTGSLVYILHRETSQE